MKKVTKKLFSSLFTSTLLLSPLASLAGEVDTATTDLGYFVSSENLGNNNTQTHLYKLKSDGEASIIISNIFPDQNCKSDTGFGFLISINLTSCWLAKATNSESSLK